MLKRIIKFCKLHLFTLKMLEHGINKWNSQHDEDAKFNIAYNKIKHILPKAWKYHIRDMMDLDMEIYNHFELKPGDFGIELYDILKMRSDKDHIFHNGKYSVKFVEQVTHDYLVVTVNNFED
jgi:hypothetical protein